MLRHRYDVHRRILGSGSRGLTAISPWRLAIPSASVGLPWGSIIALVITFIYLLCRRVISFGDAAVCIVDGFRAMVPALLILTFALTLKLATSALGADVFVAGLMEGAAAGLYSMLPAIIFLVALGLAFATGTSWGTFGILIPIVRAHLRRPSPSCLPSASPRALPAPSAAITARPFRTRRSWRLPART